MAAPRDVTPLVRIIRNAFNGRVVKNHLRFEQGMSSRDPPLPVLPRGPSHIMSANSYSERDGRRMCNPPTQPYIAGVKQIQSGDEVPSDKQKKLPVPGFGYDPVTGMGHTGMS